jgi:hypothetical protein
MRASVLAGLLALIAGQGDELQLKNIQPIYGSAGPARAAAKILPGDSLFLAFDIAGLSVKDGTAEYSLATEISAKGKLQYRQPPKDNKASLPLGGTTLQGLAQFEIGLNTPPGEYEFKVTVTDLPTKKTHSFTRTFEVAPPAFGIVRLNPTLDPAGDASTTLLGVGQTLWINFSTVGFTRDKTTMQPNLTFELNVTDAAGKSFAKPYTGSVTKDVPAMVPALPGQFPLPLNAPGKFTVEIKATDVLAGKSAKLSFPIQVQPR